MCQNSYTIAMYGKIIDIVIHVIFPALYKKYNKYITLPKIPHQCSIDRSPVHLSIALYRTID